MTPSLRRKLEALSERREEVGRLLAEPGTAADPKRLRELGREYAQLEPMTLALADYDAALADISAAQAMRNDPELRELAEAELPALQAHAEALEHQLGLLLIPPDPRDDASLFLEVRAGTGGDEAAIFAGDLFRMYAKYAENRHWPVEVLSNSPGEHGGYKEIIARIEGRGAFSRFKFESGTHRVQRVPATETQGRTHTSAATVAILPELEAIGEVELRDADLRIDTFRASGAGGQHINKTDSAVRITHLPTGTVVECQDGRSQHQNKAQALRVLAARIKAREEQAAHSKIAAERKSLVGSGDRSERIRTYNFPQGRVTDHRINLTLYKMEQIMDGDIGELTGALMAEHQAQQLAAMAETN